MSRRSVLRFEKLEDRVQPALAIMPTNAAGHGYSALDFNSSGGYVPPDTSGAAGPNAYIETVNQSVALYGNKATGGSAHIDSLDHFWHTVGGLTAIDAGAFLSDPIVAYDEKIGRFIIGDQDVDFSTHFSDFYLAVSKTNNPTTLTTASWNFYNVTTTQSGFDADYPGNFGYNADAFVFTLNMFGVSGGGHVQVVSVNSSDLLNGVTQANLHTFSNNINNFSLRPATMHDAVAGDPMWLVGTNTSTSIIVYKMTNVLSNSATVASTNITVPSYSGTVSPLNPNGTALTNNIDDRIQKAAVANGHLVAAHSIGVSSTEDDIQWYNINVSGATPNLSDKGRISGGNNVYLTYPGIDINSVGQIGMSFMRSGNDTATDYMSMYVTGRNPANAAGTMQTPIIVPAGTGLANYADFTGSGRAGDLSGINVDPVDGTFWAANEFANTEAGANWGTAVANFALPPIVSGGVTSPVANATYGIGAVIPITVTFNDPVTVSIAGGTPSLTLNAGGGATAFYASGSGTKTLTFNYTVGASQASADLDYSSTSALALNGGTITDTASTLAADLNLPAPGAAGSLGANKNIVIDSGPSVSNVTSTTANGAYGSGAVIAITITFSSAVNVTGTPLLALNSGGTASYASGTGTATLTFNYTVVAGDAAADLDYSATSSLTLNGGTIKDASTSTNAVLTLVSPGTAGSLGANKNIVIDTTVPAASNVTSAIANGFYGTGALIPITITFTKAVDVTGTPLLALSSGGTASYASGTGTTTLTFNYTVVAGETTSGSNLDYSSTSALTLNGGTIKDHLTSVAAVLTLPSPGAAGSLGSNKSIVIDTTVPNVSNVTSTTPNGTYGTGTLIPITLTFTKVVDVSGTPLLALNSGGSASYASGTGTTTLTFNYTVAAGNTTNGADLDFTSTSALTLNGGTMKDHLTGVPAVLTLPIPGATGSLAANTSIIIDAVPARPSNITSTNADGNYGFGQTIAITVAYNRPVTVTGTPKLALNSGGTASFVSGSGTNTLNFTYTVGLTDVAADLDYTATNALTLNGGTITDPLNVIAANLTLPSPGSAGSLGANKDLVIDGTPSRPANITSPAANGTYLITNVIPITVTMSKPVIVSVAGGTPTLALNSGGIATYTGGSGTFTTLTFSYTIAANQNAADLDYSSISALALNGATITDQASSTAANMTLPAPGAAGSLGANKDLVVNTIGPAVISYKVLFGSKSYDLIGSSRFDVPWTITGIQVVFNRAVAAGNIHSLTGLTAKSLTGLGTSTLTFKFTGITKGQFNTSLLSAGANALKDAAGNTIVAFSQAFNVLYGDVNDDHVVNAADETAVRAAVAPPFSVNPSYIIFADLNGDGLVNVVDVGVAHKRRGVSLP